jgi:hypothetical protein
MIPDLVGSEHFSGIDPAEVAEEIGISQPAVSKRKCAILRELRYRLGPSEEK